jgi:hypothetical protein
MIAVTRRSSDYREIEWEQLSLGKHFSLTDLAGQVQPTFQSSPMLNLGIVRHDEQGLISNSTTGACSRSSNDGSQARDLFASPVPLGWMYFSILTWGMPTSINSLPTFA